MPAHENRITLWPCLDDKTDKTSFDKYCFYLDTWVVRKIVSHIFTVAIKEDIVDTNPCSQVRRLKVIHTRDITKAVGKKYSEHFSHCTVTGVRQEYDIRKIGVVHLVIY